MGAKYSVLCEPTATSPGVFCQDTAASCVSQDACIIKEGPPCFIQARFMPCHMDTAKATSSPNGFTDLYESNLPIERCPVDFAAHRAIPNGWHVSDEVTAPGVFSVLGRDARVITDGVSNEDGHRNYKVLFALPNWAVDLRRSDHYKKFTENGSASGLCRLETFKDLCALNTVVYSFSYPTGMPLHLWVRRFGLMPESLGRMLCRDLLQLVLDISYTSIRFWGLVLPSMIFVHDTGSLQCIVPVGAIMSFEGVQASSLDIESTTLPPEILQSFDEGDRRLEWDRGGSMRADVYSMMAAVLDAMVGLGPAYIQTDQVANKLSESACDFLHKILYKDPTWRLSLRDALGHSWLKPSSEDGRKDNC